MGRPKIPTEGSKECTKCGNMLEMNSLNFRVRKWKNHIGWTSWCIGCQKKQASDYQKSPIGKAYRYKNRYGMSIEHLNHLIDEQNGICIICQKELFDPCVDHDHQSGIVRGILCRTCNSALGGFSDSVLVLQRAIDYLQGRLR